MNGLSKWSAKEIDGLLWDDFPEYYAFGEAKVEDGVIKVAKYEGKELYDEEGLDWLEEGYYTQKCYKDGNTELWFTFGDSGVRYPVVLWAVRNGILNGNGKRNAEGKKDLDLGGKVTREEFAQFLYNYDRYAA